MSSIDVDAVCFVLYVLIFVMTRLLLPNVFDIGIWGANGFIVDGLVFFVIVLWYVMAADNADTFR